VTGGTIADGKTTAPGEIRGGSIRGGETHPIARGDVVTIAVGVPHWISAVDAPIQYLVVKVAARP
jgi:quercetin dioxygenase-like cupin family protein